MPAPSTEYTGFVNLTATGEVGGGPTPGVEVTKVSDTLYRFLLDDGPAELSYALVSLALDNDIHQPTESPLLDTVATAASTEGVIHAHLRQYPFCDPEARSRLHYLFVVR